MRRISIVSILDQEDRARSITQPTLIVYGSEDHFTKPSSMRLKELLPNSKLVALKGGHLPHISSPTTFASMVLGMCGVNQGG